VRLECDERVVHWERVDLDYTFANLVLVKGARPPWRPWPRASYRPGRVVSPAT
jgi:hypothetical protein